MKLPKVVVKSKKQVGRGLGSGRGGHTSGRGQKGQGSRGDIGILFEGFKVKKSLLKRLPLSRGKGKFHAKGKPMIVNLGVLNILPAGTVVNIESLAKAGIVKLEDAKKFGVKILGGGKLTKNLKIELPTSKTVAKLLEKTGTKIKASK
jgi:large subunit ribosomal protein L15